MEDKSALIDASKATPITLKAKYSKIAPRPLKSMKSPGGNSGKNKHKKDSKNKRVQPVKIMFVNGKTGAKRMYLKENLPNG